eukprot:7288842-Prymnesium_polylepis.1
MSLLASTDTNGKRWRKASNSSRVVPSAFTSSTASNRLPSDLRLACASTTSSIVDLGIHVGLAKRTPTTSAELRHEPAGSSSALPFIGSSSRCAAGGGKSSSPAAAIMSATARVGRREWSRRIGGALI